MRKLLTFLLSALVLCGLIVIGTKEDASAAEIQRLPVSVTLVEKKGAETWARVASALSLKEQKNTLWSDDAGNRLMIYEDGTAYLFTANEVFTLEAGDDGFLLKSEMYRTAFDTAPAAVLPAGAVRLLKDGDTVKVEVAEDPLGTLAFDGLDGAVLTKQQYAPYRYPGFNFFSGPLEPGTEWFCYSDTGEHRYAIWKLTVGEDGSMTGTLTTPDGTVRPCVLYGNRDSFALVEDSTEKPALLLYGQRTKFDADALCQTRYDLVYLSLNIVSDPLGLCAEGDFKICRETKATEDLAYVLGRSLDTVTVALLRDGWAETGDMEAQYPALEGWFARLTKDGQTLLIHFDYDFSSPYEYYQFFPDAYVLYGADGAVLGWGGSKPLDHNLADSYRMGKETYFDPGAGIRGMIVGEDSYAFFLDDGRVAVETAEHEGAGDAAFEIVRVIP